VFIRSRCMAAWFIELSRGSSRSQGITGSELNAGTIEYCETGESADHPETRDVQEKGLFGISSSGLFSDPCSSCLSPLASPLQIPRT
jgi:hypothetical protein